MKKLLLFMAFIILFSSITKVGYSITLEQIAHEEAKELCEDYKTVGPFPVNIKFKPLYNGYYKKEYYNYKYSIFIEKDISDLRFIIWVYTYKDSKDWEIDKEVRLDIICPKKNKKIQIEAQKKLQKKNIKYCKTNRGTVYKSSNLNFEEAVDLVRKSNFAPHFKPKKNDVVKRHPATNRITWIWDNMTENEKKIFEYYIQFLRSSPETWVSQRGLESILK